MCDRSESKDKEEEFKEVNESIKGRGKILPYSFLIGGSMFKNRMEMIAYVISIITESEVSSCKAEAQNYKDCPFIIRHTCD